MIHHHIRALLVRIGIVALIALALQIAAAPSLADRQQQPARPTIEPTSTPTPTVAPTTAPTTTPTSTTAPTPVPGDDPDPTTPPTGRIVGTVIDLTTGAPVPGISVAVGDRQVTTDANGNYERAGLAAGSYQVLLVLTTAQGTPAQGPITVELAAGQTVVQHLALRSLQAATATATAVPTIAPTTAATAAPTTPPAPTTAPRPPAPTPKPAPPVTLPEAGGGDAQMTSFSTAMLGLALLLLGVSIWSLTERSRRRAVQRRSR